MVRIKTILALLCVVSACIGYLPLMPYLDVVSKSVFPVALAAGIYLDRKGMRRSGVLLTVVSLVFFLYYGARFSLADVVPVTANLLVCLLGVRLLSEKTGRNYLQIFALALFCLAASSLYNLSGIFLVYLLALLVLLAVSLVLLAFHAHDPELALDRPGLKKVLGTALLLPVASLPIMLLLFVVLPRTQYPLWDFMKGTGGKEVGFTEKVTPGGASSISSVSTPAFRVMCRRLPEDRLYWRGIVLNGFQGNSWVRLGTPEETPLPVRGGTTVEQTFYAEPSRSPYLLALNYPVYVTGVRRRASPDLVFTTPAAGGRISYQAVSTLSDRIAIRGEIDRPLYLGLPAHLPQRLAAAAKSVSAGATPDEILSRMERFFRSQRLSYSTKNLPVGGDALDRFLFQQKTGNCEYFASSAALFLRLAGIPARLVGGYRGGVYSDTGGYYLVTEDMAHVWVEAYLEGKGWLSIDPSAWAVNFGRHVPALGKVRLVVDALGFYWNKAVLTYNLEKQITLLRGAGERLGSLSAPKVGVRQVFPPLLVAFLIFFLYRLLRWVPASQSQRLLRRFLRVVRRRYPSAGTANQGIFEVARSCDDPAVHEFASLYGGALYTDRSLTQHELARLREIVRILGRPPGS